MTDCVAGAILGGLNSPHRNNQDNFVSEQLCEQSDPCGELKITS